MAAVPDGRTFAASMHKVHAGYLQQRVYGPASCASKCRSGLGELAESPVGRPKDHRAMRSESHGGRGPAEFYNGATNP